ncbi:MAG: putative toxin-antitoxin system toxin component, PIN family [Candidatus Eisenbacteria bacterium]|nr:putative toxin-antitoxin system toxin component, PIN family [Candidatus Eisenbacteria bacterium]
MRAVLDANVFVSGVFFSGPPYRILAAWRDGRLRPVLSAEILEEYRRVGARLSAKYEGVELEPFLSLLAVHAEIAVAPGLREAVSTDPDDDKFLACALASRCRVIVSGDRDLLSVSGYRGIEVTRPREFVDWYLANMGR